MRITCKREYTGTSRGMAWVIGWRADDSSRGTIVRDTLSGAIEVIRKMRCKYRLYDVYEGHELLCASDDINEIAAACVVRDYDTDGEWNGMLKVDGVICDNWHYEVRGHDGDRTRIVFE